MFDALLRLLHNGNTSKIETPILTQWVRSMVELRRLEEQKALNDKVLELSEAEDKRGNRSGGPGGIVGGFGQYN